METSNKQYSDDHKDHLHTIKGILIGVAYSILVVMGLIMYLFYKGGLRPEMIIMGASILPILVALEFARNGRTEISGVLIAFTLTFMITLLATVGQGIHDIGIMAYPGILLIASLILRREVTLFLTISMIVCVGWLIYGEIYGVYHPVYPDPVNDRFFIVAFSILVVTSITIQHLSNLVQSNLHTAQKELQERKRAEQELREAETLYRALVEQTSVVVYRDSPDTMGATQYISPQVETMLGFSVQQWKDDPTFWMQLTHPEDLPQILSGIEDYIATGMPAQFEYRMKTRDGQWKWVRDESVVIKDEQGKPRYIHGVLIDITERKEAEEKLKQREAVLSAVAYTSQELMQSSNWRTTIQGILARLGEVTVSSHVYIFENHPGEDGVLCTSMKYEWIAPGIQSDLDNPKYQNSRLVPPPGMEDWYHFLSSGRPFYGSGAQYPRYWQKVFEERGLKTLLEMPILVNGQWWGIIGFDDYIYEMQWSQAEIDALAAAAGILGTAIERQLKVDELRFSEEKFHMAFHHTYVAMAINRASDSIFLDVNESFCKVTGYSRDEALGRKAGRDLNIWVRQEDRDFVLDILAKQGYVDEYKASFRRKNGEAGIGLVSAVNISVGGESCQLFSFYDISKIEELLDELKAKNEELQSFTYTVSHDLKAPLVTIAGFLGYLEQDARKSDMDRLNRDVLRINEAVNKMQRLLSELLELSRIGRIINPPEVVPFEEIVREALGLVEGRLEARQVHVQIEASLPAVYGDRVRLVEVLQNLVENAVRFLGDQSSPRIEIGTEVREGKPMFYVRDNGMGIEPEHHERIFGLFNKLDANTEGTGIGLALVKRIVEVHGGKIWVESVGKGKGSTFYFTFAEQQSMDQT